jgi:integrase
MRLAELRGDDIDAAIATLSERSASTRHKVFVTASKALTDALRWKVVPYNPARDAVAPAQPGPRPVAWSPTEVGRFLEAARSDRWWPLWRLAATTGLRRGELVGLRWSNVDLDGGELVVAENRTLAAGRVVVGTPKSDRVRPVAIDPATIAVLRAWRVAQVSELLALGEYRPDHDYVFTWADGSVVDPLVVTKTFGRIAKRAGLPPLRLHNLRHAWASSALDAGVDLVDVSKRLGHASTRITSDIYIERSSERDAAAAAKVAELYGSGGC